MNCHILMIVCGVIFLACLTVPAAQAADPLWTEGALPGNEITGVVISEDGSTVVAGGDQLIVLSREGKKQWTGWSGNLLAISRDGSYIVTSQAQTVRLFTGNGIMLWDQSIGVPVTDLSITPDASLIAVSGGNTVRTIYNSGTSLGSNYTAAVNHIAISPIKDQVIVTTVTDIQRFNLSIVPEWYDDNATQDLVAMNADGTAFVTVTYNRVRMYHGSGALLWEKTIPGGNALALGYSRDGSIIVLGRDDNTVQALDRTGTLLWTAPAANWVTSVAVSDNGSTIAAGSMDKNLYIYDLKGTRLETFTATTPLRSHSVAMSGDGSLIVAVDDSTVYGFSRTQLTRPVTTTALTTAAPPGTKMPLPATTVPVTPSQGEVPATTGTPRAALPLEVPLMALGLLLLVRSWKF
jgi:WD40 repeat protein